MSLIRTLALGLPLIALLGAVGSRDVLPPIGYHDNTVASGSDRNGVREVTFEIRRGLMQPNGPGGLLLLHQGEPTTVRVNNHSMEHTALHWHGMELENRYDGVVGVGGTPGEHTRAIAPGASFEAAMTPPRAGTFIYHTHLMELRQMESGLYGAMIVLPPGAAWDAAHDHVFILGSLYTKGVVLNGAKVAPALEFDAGSVHRLRLINITTGAPGVRFQLVRPDTSLVTWRRQAKDAIDLPASRRVNAPAQQGVGMGETYDMLFTPPAPGEYRLEIRSAAGLLLAQQPIRVIASKR
jgi:manganese oxidase